ncbi:MAG: class I SAM-dependent methyltransferase [bacterium]
MEFNDALSLIIKDIVGPCFYPLALKFLKKEILKERKIEEWLDFNINFHKKVKNPFLIPIMKAFAFTHYQINEEILEFLKILSAKKPRVLLEIGTANGGTLFLFSRVASDDSIIISIDLPGGAFGGGYHQWRIPLYKAFASQTQKIYLIRGDSHKYATLANVKKITADNKLDFLFIDGDHTYNGVKSDFELYSPLVKSGGIIAFHDIVPSHFVKYCIATRAKTGDVYKFWEEIKNDYQHQEIIAQKGQDGYGIGVIYWC